MKLVKSISLFFIMAVFFTGVGMFLGIQLSESLDNGTTPPFISSLFEPGRFHAQEHTEQPYTGPIICDLDPDNEALQVAEQKEKLDADTELVILEKDILRDTMVETTTNMPDKFLGMTRENFESAMNIYESAPPLSEKERGFQGLEIQSFSADKVVLQMNYKYVQPGSCFYLGVVDHEIVVFLEDKETIYINTGILLEKVSFALQQEIMALKYIENEEILYGILEGISS